MKQYLRETWELFYWALWCPSRLQQRMNDWVPLDSDTRFRDILFAKFHFRFSSQFLLLIGVLSLPLLLTGATFFPVIIVFVLLTAYSVSFLFLPLSLSIPFLCFFIFLDPGNELEFIWTEVLDAIIILPLSQIALGIGVGSIGIGITSAIVFTLLRGNQLNWSRNAFVIGNTFSALIGGALATENLFLTFLLTGFFGFSSFTVKNNLQNENDAVVVAGGVAGRFAGVVAGGVAVVFAGGVTVVVAVGVAVFFAVGVAVAFAEVVAEVVAGGVAGGVAVVLAVGVAVGVVVVVAVGVVGITKLSLFWFLIIVAVVAVCSSYPKPTIWLLLFASFYLTILGAENLGVNTLWVIPIFFLCHFRLFPDYLFLSLLLQLRSIAKILLGLPKTSPLKQLQQLPPYSTELLWLPLPGHSQLIIAAFQKNPTQALPILQKMQAMLTPGFQRTIHQALSQIVANLLAKINSIDTLLQTTSPNHPILPILVPSFSTEFQDNPIKTKIPTDLAIILPRLQTIVQDVNNALEAGSIALKERSLERIINNLKLLSAQLPSLGIRGPTLPRWQPVLQRWQGIIQLELEEQRKQSRGELLNPFLYGNPLRIESKNLFKGRRTFADQIVRLILDKNRPTLVLLGPRRTGKTSFLVNLPRLLPRDYIPIYIDLQRAGMTSSEGDFCYGLARATYKDSRSQAIQLPAPPTRKEFLQNPYTTLEDWLDDNLPQLGSRRLLFCLDEFEKIGTALTEGRLTQHLLDELRHLIQHGDRLSFLFSGVQALDELGPNWSSYFISTTPIKMLYLESAEAEDLLRNPDPDFQLQYHPEVIPEILRLTRCQPYLLQLLGASLVTVANQQGGKIATPDMLQQAIPKALEQGEPYFANVWSEYTGTTAAECRAGQIFLQQLVLGQQPEPNPEAIAAIQRMVKYHLLEPTGNGNYRIEIPLIHQWILVNEQ